MPNTREKLEVIAHLGDHITYKEDIGICYDSALAKVIEDAYITLKNGVTIQQWIPVTERLPEDRTKILGYDNSCFGKYHRIVRFANCLEDVDELDFKEYKHSGFYDYDPEYGYYEVTEITHWMPLPEPPKGD